MANPFEKYLGPEDHLHIQVCGYILWTYKGAKIHHSPNEGKRSKFEQFKMKVMNVSAGWPDLFITYKGKAIVVELKTKKNKKPTANQSLWLEILNGCGIPSEVCTNYENAVQFIDFHFKK